MNTVPSHPPRCLVAAGLVAATLLAGSGLSGCSASLLPKPPAAAARYTLGGPPASPSALPAVGDKTPVLVVAQPVAAPGYDTTRMQYQRRPQQLEAFAFHEWVEPPARLLAPLLSRALQDTQAFRAVVLAPTAGDGALRLETELVSLQQDFATQPSAVHLTLRAVLIATATRRVLASRVFEATVPAASDDPVAGVAAAQQATQRVLGELASACAGWSRDAAVVQAAQPAPPTAPAR
jgi:cholesterol transport system auxiliary component